MDGRSDIAVDELQAVIAMRGIRLAREAEAVQRAVEPVSGPIAGKNASGAVAAVRGRGESDDKQARIEPAEAGDGFAPVFLIPEAANSFPSDLLAIEGEPPAEPAGFDLALGAAATFRQGREGS